MKYGKVPGIDKKVSRLVQGTIMVRPENKAETFPLLDAVYAAAAPPSTPPASTAAGRTSAPSASG
jgi:hypothetical protein